MFGRNLYSRKFFAHLRDGSARSAHALVPIVLDIHPARSMVDVGCGVGGWVKAFADRGVDAVGVDGDYVDRKQLLIEGSRFVAHDLNRELEFRISAAAQNGPLRSRDQSRSRRAPRAGTLRQPCPRSAARSPMSCCSLPRSRFRAAQDTSTSAGNPGGRRNSPTTVTIRSTFCAAISGAGATSPGGTSRTRFFT